MKIKHNDIEIVAPAPFTNCKLGREQYASVLTDIVKSFSEGFVLAIDNEWGTGKTTFVKMWKQHLENLDYKTLYFNAWENDFEQDVLIAMISELKVLQTSKNEELFKKVLNNAVPLVKSLALGILKTQVEKHVGNEFTQEIVNQSSSTLADKFQKQIDIYTNRKKGIVAFRESLQEFVALATDYKPVVFIIDELDRCRPNYAVELLEQLKHVFSVPGIVFVLSIDKNQLGNAIKGFYGSDLIDSDEYLRRFIDIEYSIPEPDAKLFCEYLYEYFQFDKFLSSQERLEHRELQNDKSYFLDFSAALFEYGALPLRVQEKIFAHARLSLMQFQPNTYLIPTVFVLLLYLKIKHKEIYVSIKDAKYSLQDLADKIENIFPERIEKEDLRLFLYTEARLIQAYNNAKSHHLRESIVIKVNGNSENKLIIKSKLDKSENNVDFLEIFDSFNRTFSRIDDIGVNHLISKIELTEMIR